MTTHRTDDPLDTLLQELGPADPPAGFTDSVLSKVARTHIEAAHGRASGKVIPFSNGGVAMSITKKAMWGLAAAAAIILAVFVARGFPTVDRGTEGAIGAAKKYQAPQLAAGDVVTGDASVQEFLQSETFDQLMKDPNARTVLADADMRALLRDDAMHNALRQTAVRDAIRAGLFNRIFDDAAARAALEDALKASMARGAVAKVSAADMKAQLDDALKSLNRANLHPNTRADLESAIRNADLRQALSDDAFRQQMSRSSVREMLSRREMSAALAQRAFADALNHKAFRPALASSRFESALNAR